MNKNFLICRILKKEKELAETKKFLYHAKYSDDESHEKSEDEDIKIPNKKTKYEYQKSGEKYFCNRVHLIKLNSFCSNQTDNLPFELCLSFLIF